MYNIRLDFLLDGCVINLLYYDLNRDSLERSLRFVKSINCNVSLLTPISFHLSSSWKKWISSCSRKAHSHILIGSFEACLSGEQNVSVLVVLSVSLPGVLHQTARIQSLQRISTSHRRIFSLLPVYNTNLFTKPTWNVSLVSQHNPSLCFSFYRFPFCLPLLFSLCGYIVRIIRNVVFIVKRNTSIWWYTSFTSNRLVFLFYDC